MTAHLGIPDFRASVTAHLGIPDLLADGPKSASELAQELGAEFIDPLAMAQASETVDASSISDTEFSLWGR